MSTITLGGLAATLFSSSDLLKLKQRIASFEHLKPNELATNEEFWEIIQQAYTPTSLFINLNNGGVCPQPKAVQESFIHYYELGNSAPAYYMFGEFTRQREGVKKKLAALAGCSHEEISLTRNATEAIETVIMGLDLKRGDEIITTNQDYPTVMAGLQQRARREGIKIVQISLPTPAENNAEVVQLFEKAITPNTKLIVISHMVYMTGQILPVRQVCDMAHEHNLEVIVDGAHTFAQLEFNIPDLNCDYFGTSLHKWLCAPFGCGMLYMKKEKIGKVWSLFGSPEEQKDSMLKFEHLGTRSFPAELAINEAVDFHNMIGIQRKEARLRYLKDYWATAVKDVLKVKFNTSLKKEFSGALCNFSIEGMTADELHKQLFDDYKIYTTTIKHADFEGARVAPNVYTKLSDLDKLIAAIKEMAKQ